MGGRRHKMCYVTCWPCPDLPRRRDWRSDCRRGRRRRPPPSSGRRRRRRRSQTPLEASGVLVVVVVVLAAVFLLLLRLSPPRWGRVPGRCGGGPVKSDENVCVVRAMSFNLKLSPYFDPRRCFRFREPPLPAVEERPSEEAVAAAATVAPPVDDDVVAPPPPSFFLRRRYLL